MTTENPQRPLANAAFERAHHGALTEASRRQVALRLKPLYDVLAERFRQICTEGYIPEHDDAHPSGEIAAFAAFYAMPPAVREWPASETGYGATWGQAIVPTDWIVPKTGDRRRELIKAGALILAEIERLDRASGRADTAAYTDLTDGLTVLIAAEIERIEQAATR